MIKTLAANFLKLLCAFLLPILTLVFVLAEGVYAVAVVHESYVATEPSSVVFAGDVRGGQFGAALSTGDFNGDSVADLFVGSPFASTDAKVWNGAVKIIFGERLEGVEYRASGDVTASIGDVNFYGKESGDQFGTSIAAGDFNGDGLSDLAIGAHNAMASVSRSGKVYIMYGSQNPAVNSPKNFELSGFRDGDGFGLALEIADVNNDGIDDLLVGAPFADAPDVDDTGSVYVYFGSVNGLSSLQNVQFQGQSSGERFGAAMTGGDIDGDGNTDLLFSAYTANNGLLEQAGKVYIYNGRENVFAEDGPHEVVDTYEAIIAGDFDHAWFGFALDAGDLNDDERDDVAISYFPYKGDRTMARVAIFMGDGDVVSDVLIKDPVNDSLPGASILLKDLDKDAKSEIIIGAPGIGDVRSADEGDTYIFYSRNSRHAPVYSIAQNNMSTIIHGEKADDWFGYSLAVLDFNGDGLRDLAIGSRYSDVANSVNDGKVFILLNNGEFFGEARAILRGDDGLVTRGELVDAVLDSLKIMQKKSDSLADCYAHLDFCLFNFMAMSSYDDIQLEPDLILYPDVPANHMYADSINAATMLEIVNGYMGDTSSPFRPEKTVTRMEALKVILGAADLVDVKYKFEMIEMLGSYKALLSQYSYFEDINSRIPQMWWYPRYTNFAVDHDIIDLDTHFRPHEEITENELLDMLGRTLRNL